MLCKERDFLVSIVSIAVKGHYYGLTKALHVLYMTVKIGKTCYQCFAFLLTCVAISEPSVHLQATQCGDKNSHTRIYISLTTLDIKELLCT